MPYYYLPQDYGVRCAWFTFTKPFLTPYAPLALKIKYNYQHMCYEVTAADGHMIYEDEAICFVMDYLAAEYPDRPVMFNGMKIQ